MLLQRSLYVSENPNFRIRMSRDSSEKFFTEQNHIWTTTLVTNFDLAISSRGYSTDPFEFY